MEAVREMESVEKIQAINKTSWKQRMKSYKRTPLSFVLWLLVNVAMIATVAVLAYLIVYILVNGVPYLNSQLFELKYTSENASVFPAIINTLIMTVLSLLFAVPLGIFAAIYLVEYAKRGNKLVEIVRLTAETLSGIPSIVYGLFGMLFFVKALGWGLCLLSGAATMAIMILPLIMRTTEEALKSVPDSYREGSFGLGAGKLRTVFRIILRGITYQSGICNSRCITSDRACDQRRIFIYCKTNYERVTNMDSKMKVENLDLYYGKFKALKNINLDLPKNEITAFIGPSGCGKSTLLKSLNRMNDLVEGCKITGKVTLDGEDIYGDMDVNLLRKRVGMVFQKPNPFPMSIYDNIAYGPRTHGIRSKAKLDDIVEKSLRNAAIWDELKDRLKKSALGLSGGQQQRLCIARALAVEPEVLLMDEPTSALDPISTSKIEDLAVELKSKYTIIMVTHNMQQAVRISDNTAFFLLGEMVEYGKSDQLFSMPQDKRTEDYITGRFG